MCARGALSRNRTKSSKVATVASLPVCRPQRRCFVFLLTAVVSAKFNKAGLQKDEKIRQVTERQREQKDIERLLTVWKGNS